MNRLRRFIARLERRYCGTRQPDARNLANHLATLRTEIMLPAPPLLRRRGQELLRLLERLEMPSSLMRPLPSNVTSTITPDHCDEARP